ncbi:MAG: ATP-dependent DNA ligase [Planctomycetota bacterium]|nr:MAG: ATP-dependent DNA ligase [Planctomycetota bacterium]
MQATSAGKPDRGAVRFATLGLALVLGTLAAPLARAHFTILIPDRPAVAKGEPVTLSVLYGHPFERELGVLKRPAALWVRSPQGLLTDLTGRLVPLAGTVREDGVASGWQVRFTPEERGDWVVFMRAEPVSNGKEELTDFVKVVIHVGTEQGWDATLGQPLELVPLTRPYGLRAGLSVRAQLLRDHHPLPGTPVFVERYNDAPPPPGTLPPGEHITRIEKTDPNGVLAATLDAPGWWMLAAEAPAVSVPLGERRLQWVHRAVLWVYVDEVPAGWRRPAEGEAERER